MSIHALILTRVMHIQWVNTPIIDAFYEHGIHIHRLIP